MSDYCFKDLLKSVFSKRCISVQILGAFYYHNYPSSINTVLSQRFVSDAHGIMKNVSSQYPRIMSEALDNSWLMLPCCEIMEEAWCNAKQTELRNGRQGLPSLPLITQLQFSHLSNRKDNTLFLEGQMRFFF